ncbi:hypothetical protein E3E51_00770 [Thermococcus sp. 21S7]|nr:hypothetical protein [Thermococcus sp. 21S7]
MILLGYTPSRHRIPTEEQIPWTQNCSNLVEYPIPEDLPHVGWEKTRWGEVHPGENITIVNILKLKGKWDFNLTGCAYENDTLFLKFTSKRLYEQATSTFETTTAPLLYISIIRVVTKVDAEKVVVYITGDLKRRLTIQLKPHN